MTIAVAPLHVSESGQGFALSFQSAAAKPGDGNGGKGDHGKGPGGPGKGGPGGPGKGDPGKGKGDSGKGKGNGGIGAPDVDDGGTGAGPGDVQSVNPATGDRVTIRGKAIAVLHRNGMRESVKGGRYLMTDNKGRTIIERTATNADVLRLHKLGG